jgi:TonB family protein
VQVLKVDAGAVTLSRNAALDNKAILELLLNEAAADWQENGWSASVSSFLPSASWHIVTEEQVRAVGGDATLGALAHTLPHGFAGNTVVAGCTAGKGAPVETGGENRWLVAVAPSEGLDKVMTLAERCKLRPNPIGPGALDHIGAISRLLSVTGQESVALWELGLERSHLFLVSAAGVEAVVPCEIKLSDIWEAIRVELNLKYQLAAARLFYGDLFDFSDAAPRIAGQLAPALTAALDALPTKGEKPAFACAGLTPTQNWLVNHVAAALGTTNWQPDPETALSELGLHVAGDLLPGQLTPASFGLLHRASANAKGTSLWKPVWHPASAANFRIALPVAPKAIAPVAAPKAAEPVKAAPQPAKPAPIPAPIAAPRPAAKVPTPVPRAIQPSPKLAAPAQAPAAKAPAPAPAQAQAPVAPAPAPAPAAKAPAPALAPAPATVAKATVPQPIKPAEAPKPAAPAPALTLAKPAQPAAQPAAKAPQPQPALQPAPAPKAPAQAAVQAAAKAPAPQPAPAAKAPALSDSQPAAKAPAAPVSASGKVSTPTTPAQPAAKKKSPMALIGGIAAAVIIGAGVFFFWQQNQAAKREAAMVAAAKAQAAEAAKIEAERAAEALQVAQSEAARLRAEAERNAAIAAENDQRQQDADRRAREAQEALARAPGVILVTSDPIGAEVVVDGATPQVTPAVITNVAPGLRKVTLRLPGYESVEQLAQIKGAQTLDMGTVSLQRLFGELMLRSEPADAEFAVYPASALEGTPLRTGRTPGRVNNLQPGEYVIKFTRQGLLPTSEHATITGKEIIDVNSTFIVGGVSLTSNPVGATVSMNGETLGITPIVRPNQAPGTATFEFTLPNHETQKLTGEITNKDTLRLHAEMLNVDRIAKKDEVKTAVKIIKPVMPEIPAELAPIKGEVVLSVVVTRKGTISDIRVDKSSNPALTDPCLKAINLWQFSPAISKAGQPVNMRISIPFKIDIAPPPPPTSGPLRPIGFGT